MQSVVHLDDPTVAALVDAGAADAAMAVRLAADVASDELVAIGTDDPALVARCATVVCDDVAGSRVECGDLIRAEAVGCFDWARAVELHDVAAGSAIAARPGDAPVLFETQGVAIQDVAACAVAFERYVARSAQPVAVMDDERYTEDQEVTR
jgi:hypothetical protein